MVKGHLVGLDTIYYTRCTLLIYAHKIYSHTIYIITSILLESDACFPLIVLSPDHKYIYQSCSKYDKKHYWQYNNSYYFSNNTWRHCREEQVKIINDIEAQTMAYMEMGKDLVVQ